MNPGGLFDDTWLVVSQNDAAVCRLFRRHYSARPAVDYGRHGVAGPGEVLALITPCERATIVFRVFQEGPASRYVYSGLFLTIFRNEGAGLSSGLIRAAEPIAWQRWPDAISMRTFVDTSAVRSGNPGCCFQKADWQRCGVTKGGLLVFAKHRDGTSGTDPV